jgi:hypothetical protein
MGEPAEMGRGLIGGFADCLEIQAAGDDGGDVSEEDAFFGDGVESLSGGKSFFEDEAVEFRGVEAMDGGPGVGSVANVGGEALFAGEGDEVGNEAVIALAVDGRGEAHDGDVDAAFG